MLSSWFGQQNPKEEDGGVSSRTTPTRPSTSSPTEPNQAQRASTEKPPKRTFPTAYTTPHDTILSELQGNSPRPAAIDASNYPASIREGAASPELDYIVPSREDKSTVPRTEINPSGLLTSNPPSQRISLASSPELLIDPFDGMSLGVLLPHQDNPTADDRSPSQSNLLSVPEIGTGSISPGSEAVWANLSRVLDIQSQISKMHLEMEDIGSGKVVDTKGKKRQKEAGPTVGADGTAGNISGIGSEDPILPPGLQRPRERVLSTVSTVSSTGDGDSDEEGVNVPSEKAEKTRRREEEFAKLATQFEGRKDAIQGIMDKLDELSHALYQFHHLPPPTMEIFNAPRTNPVGSPLSTASPQQSGESDNAKFKSVTASNTPSISNRTPEWAQQNAVAGSLLPPPLDRRKSDTVILGAPLSRPGPQNKAVPMLLLNSVDLETHTPIMDSPVSIDSSLKRSDG